VGNDAAGIAQAQAASAAPPRTPYFSPRISIARPYEASSWAKTVDGWLLRTGFNAVLNEKRLKPQCQKIVRRADLVWPSTFHVMAGLVPAIHVLNAGEKGRGCPGQARTSPGMTGTVRSPRFPHSSLPVALQTCVGILATQCVRGLRIMPSAKQRAQGKPGARCTHSLACEIDKAHERSHHRFTGFTRPSLRNGFNGLYRALPGDRAFLPPSLPRELLPVKT
jgi:hypothetical protein